MTSATSGVQRRLAKRLQKELWYFEYSFSTILKIYERLFSVFPQEQLQDLQPQRTFHNVSQCFMDEIKKGHQGESLGLVTQEKLTRRS